MQSSQDTVPDSDELVRFREAWKAEVRKKKTEDATASRLTPLTAEPQADSATSSGPATVSNVSAPNHAQSPRTHTVPLRPVTRPPDRAELVQRNETSIPYGKVLGRAVELYRRAVQCEQQSKLDDALQLYRVAFRMDSNVDRAYHKLETQQDVSGSAATSASFSHRKSPSASAGPVVDEIAQAIKALDVHSRLAPVSQIGNAIVTGTLASIIAGWPPDLTFAPEDEKEGVLLQKLPDELLVHILRGLDTATLERFATVNRKARVVTLDTELWKNFVRAIYKPPQIPDDEDMDALLHHYTADFRRLYIEQPRVRFDGVYIAVCHYIRPGLSETAWMNVSHLVTYHRYLRFYPNGQVLSLLANEEMAPQQVIPVLKPTMRMKARLIRPLNLLSWLKQRTLGSLHRNLASFGNDDELGVALASSGQVEPPGF
ncbi:uncharacterized protein FIBRA_03871 [Fibroporia radiculosa]|uniref:F-box domain-containing protein n=1 Tax=Fibroporia radiculosa TaxID=599839 RepID=J4H2M9_9APHY|nr:uncharacterized protein FIBRA_03871 [Fibroporia radiculosa]CCM01804.1 predicted protein [Fibroporia radiculosa]